MQKRARNEVFSHLIQFDLFEWSDIANDDCGKCFSTFGHGDRSCLINYLCMTGMIYAEKGQR